MRFRAYDTQCLHFFGIQKLEQLQITVLTQSNYLSKTFYVLKGNFNYYCLNIFSKHFRIGQMFYGLWYTLTLFLSTMKLERLQITILKWSCDLRKIINIFKKIFDVIVQMYLESSSEWLICFRAFDTRYLHFYRILNCSYSKSLFWSDHATLVKPLIFSKDIFMTVVHIYFQIDLLNGS